jgi:hypothetical protein
MRFSQDTFLYIRCYTNVLTMKIRHSIIGTGRNPCNVTCIE